MRNFVSRLIRSEVLAIIIQGRSPRSMLSVSILAEDPIKAAHSSAARSMEVLDQGHD